MKIHCNVETVVGERLSIVRLKESIMAESTIFVQKELPSSIK